MVLIAESYQEKEWNWGQCMRLLFNEIASLKKISLVAMLVSTAMMEGGIAAAQDISTLANESSSISSWGLPDTAAYGQTFMVNSTSRLNNVTFRINDGGIAITYDAKVFAWDSVNKRVMGAALASASSQTAGASGMQTVTITTDGANLAGAGTYVVFLQATSAGNASWGSTDDATYADGTFVFQNNSGDILQWDSTAWTDGFGLDLAFALNFFFGPTQSEELTSFLSTTGGAARIILHDAAGVVRDQSQLSLAKRSASTNLTPGGTGSLTISSMGAASGLKANVYTWAKITGFDTDTGAKSVGGRGLQAGADVAISPEMVAGISVGYTDISAADSTFSQNGTLLVLQPYLAYRSGDWHGNASLILGNGDYDQTSLGGQGSGKTRLTALALEGGYDYALTKAFTLSPGLSLISGREIAEGVSGTLAGAGKKNYDFTQTSLGARINHTTTTGSLFAGLYADYLQQDAGSVLTSDLLSESGWSGRIELGGSTTLSNGLNLSTSIEASGVGSNARTVSGNVWVGFTF
jgi:hypothetical protein